MNKLFKFSLLYLFLNFSISSAAALKNDDDANGNAWTREYNKIEEQHITQYSGFRNAQQQEERALENQGLDAPTLKKALQKSEKKWNKKKAELQEQYEQALQQARETYLPQWQKQQPRPQKVQQLESDDEILSRRKECNDFLAALGQSEWSQAYDKIEEKYHKLLAKIFTAQKLEEQKLKSQGLDAQALKQALQNSKIKWKMAEADAQSQQDREMDQALIRLKLPPRKKFAHAYQANDLHTWEMQ